MTNHFHLVVETPQADLPAGIGFSPGPRPFPRSLAKDRMPQERCADSLTRRQKPSERSTASGTRRAGPLRPRRPFVTFALFCSQDIEDDCQARPSTPTKPELPRPRQHGFREPPLTASQHGRPSKSVRPGLSHPVHFSASLPHSGTPQTVSPLPSIPSPHPKTT
jgi:hypothetical protein